MPFLQCSILGIKSVLSQNGNNIGGDAGNDPTPTPAVFSADAKAVLYLGRKLKFHLYHSWWPFENALSPWSRSVPELPGLKGSYFGQNLTSSCLTHSPLYSVGPGCGPECQWPGSCSLCNTSWITSSPCSILSILWAKKVPERFCWDLTLLQ